MILIVGLGNPGKKYTGSRHNLGSMVVKELAKVLETKFRYSIRSNADVAKKKYENENILLALPQTFMNNSGRAVRKIVAKKHIEYRDMLVVYDDLDLDFGRMRMRKRGSSGGHRGIESIIQELGIQDFARIKIGIGRPRSSVDPTDYVLSNFNSSERKELPSILDKAVQVCLDWINEGQDCTLSTAN